VQWGLVRPQGGDLVPIPLREFARRPTFFLPEDAARMVVAAPSALLVGMAVSVFFDLDSLASTGKLESAADRLHRLPVHHGPGPPGVVRPMLVSAAGFGLRTAAMSCTSRAAERDGARVGRRVGAGRVQWEGWRLLECPTAYEDTGP
jgi:hypothetical protein